jgi:hypothetical protein
MVHYTPTNNNRRGGINFNMRGHFVMITKGLIHD